MTEFTEEERERLAHATWQGHRKRQLESLGINVDKIDGEDQ